MRRQTSQLLTLLLCCFVLVFGCSTRSKVTRQIKRSETLMKAGDEALALEDWSAAQRSYEEADTLLRTSREAASKLEGPIQEKWSLLSEQLGHRTSLYGKPEEALEGILRIAGQDNEALLRAVWNPSKAAEKVVGKDHWKGMRRETQTQLVDVTHALIVFAVGTNLNFYATVQQDIQEIAVENGGATLAGIWRYGNTEMSFEAYLQREGPVWQIVDAKTDLFGKPVSAILSKSIEYLEKLRPIEEILEGEDASRLIRDAFYMALEGEGLSTDEETPVVFTKMDAPLELENGEKKTITAGSCLALLGKTRVKDGQTQLLVRPVFFNREDESGETILYNKLVGWMPENAFPVTEEASVWGVEEDPFEIPMPGS